MQILDGDLYYRPPEGLDADFEIVNGNLIATFDPTVYDFNIVNGNLIMEEL